VSLVPGKVDISADVDKQSGFFVTIPF